MNAQCIFLEISCEKVICPGCDVIERFPLDAFLSFSLRLSGSSQSDRSFGFASVLQNGDDLGKEILTCI